MLIVWQVSSHRIKSAELHELVKSGEFHLLLPSSLCIILISSARNAEAISKRRENEHQTSSHTAARSYCYHVCAYGYAPWQTD